MPRSPDDALAIRPDRDGSGSKDRPGGGPERLESSEEADRRGTVAAYDEHKRQFVAAGGAGMRFDALRLLQAARLHANRLRGVLARARGDAPAPASEEDVRNSLDGLAVEAETARSKGRLRAFTRRLWPFGTPWR